MKILLTNDDGIDSEGLRLLGIELQKNHDVYIVAPKKNQSAVSHAITLHKPMELKKVRLEGIKNDAYSLTGTPADCVRVGLELLYKDIEVIFSGINNGYNAGADVQYSGTVGGAAEGIMYNIPSVAISAERVNGESDFNLAAKFGPYIFEKYKDLVMDHTILLNINVPKLEEAKIKGMKLCKLGGVIYDSFKMEEIDEETSEILLLDRKPREIEAYSDRDMLRHGYVTITPMTYGFVDDEVLEKFRKRD